MEKMIYSLVFKNTSIINIVTNAMPKKVEGNIMHYPDFKFQLAYNGTELIMIANAFLGTHWPPMKISNNLLVSNEINAHLRCKFKCSDAKNVYMTFEPK